MDPGYKLQHESTVLVLRMDLEIKDYNKDSIYCPKKQKFYIYIKKIITKKKKKKI